MCRPCRRIAWKVQDPKQIRNYVTPDEVHQFVCRLIEGDAPVAGRSLDHPLDLSEDIEVPRDPAPFVVIMGDTGHRDPTTRIDVVVDQYGKYIGEFWVVDSRPITAAEETARSAAFCLGPAISARSCYCCRLCFVELRLKCRRVKEFQEDLPNAYPDCHDRLLDLRIHLTAP